MMKSLITVGLLAALTLVGCDSDDDSSSSGLADAGTAADVANGDSASGTSVCAPGETQACLCVGADGVQVCEAGGASWGSCVCEAPSPDAGAPEDGSATDAQAVSDAGPSGDAAVETCEYIGGWPCNPDKESMADPGWDGGPCPGGPGCDCVSDSGCASERCVEVLGTEGDGRCLPAIGSLPPRLKSVDQHGDLVDLYDFAGHDTPVVIALSAGWAMAGLYETWLKGDDTTGMIPDSWTQVRVAVLNGELRWITLLLEDSSQTPATPEYQAQWNENFGFTSVPILLDSEYAFTTHYSQYGEMGIPSLLVFDGDLQLLANGVDSSAAASQALTDMF
ncbi:MAG: hypothetical protein CL940_12130 [Deltaproteobacteria bacterium]|nr:hypothetical protein [Deltaproteobacteria bacterium]